MHDYDQFYLEKFFAKELTTYEVVLLLAQNNKVHYILAHENLHGLEDTIVDTMAVFVVSLPVFAKPNLDLNQNYNDSFFQLAMSLDEYMEKPLKSLSVVSRVASSGQGL